MNFRFYFIYLTVFVNVMAFTLIFPLLPTYAQRFNASTLEIGMLAGSFGLAQLFCSPLWGRVSDRIGRKPTIMMCVSGLGLGFLVLAVSQSLGMLFVGRLIQGIFSGASLPSARAYAADMSDKAGRVKSMGRIEAALALGTILGPFIGGVLAESSFTIPIINFSVQQSITTPFFFSFLFAMLNFLLVFFFLPESLSNELKLSRGKRGSSTLRKCVPSLPVRSPHSLSWRLYGRSGFPTTRSTFPSSPNLSWAFLLLGSGHYLALWELSHWLLSSYF